MLDRGHLQRGDREEGAGAVANLSYYAASKGSAHWWFDIGSGTNKVFIARFPPC